jgi:AraC family transcriptional regulator
MKTEVARRKMIAEQYRGRINTAVDYIERNLNQDFSLDQIAAVAGFSKYHFHRIFYTFTGESLFQFIQRLRLEKAATLF